eukprot:scaffold95263_cov39-Phaeocystis_antarctica.AAC.1
MRTGRHSSTSGRALAEAGRGSGPSLGCGAAGRWAGCAASAAPRAHATPHSSSSWHSARTPAWSPSPSRSRRRHAPHTI